MWHAWGSGEVRTEIWWGKTDGKRPLRRLKYRCEKIIETDLREMRWESVDWIDMAQYKGTLWAIVDMAQYKGTL
jgi:hypothetical protein